MGVQPIMSDSKTTEELFFDKSEMSNSSVQKLLSNTLRHSDDGELFFEYEQSESFIFDDGILRSANFDTNQGFGLRAIHDQTVAYAHSSELTEKAINRAAKTVNSVKSGHSGNVNDEIAKTNQKLYCEDNPLDSIPFSTKVKVLEDVDKFVRDLDNRVKQVTASLAGSWQAVRIMRANGSEASDIRPLVRLNISCVVGDNNKMESGSYGAGGRETYENFLKNDFWEGAAREAYRQAIVNLDSAATPAGEMPVVLGPGWPAILLHEAIGHGLEGDFNRKKTSAFSELLGEKIASSGVTVVDDGTIENRRGSLTIDDEGTPTQRTVLVEDGILKSYMHDRTNARLMGQKPTGNGRRESYGHAPMPRMTNTIMINGNDEPDDIISSVKKGLYAVNFGGGQVDITSGKFVFSCTEAYLIENGKIGNAVKGATLIGNGPDVLKRITMIGNDMSLDPGVGTCGKDGQGVPVGVGQPTILLNELTVGGTEI